MDGGSRAESSSPLATVADIQRRLLRPISSISSPDGVVGAGSEHSSQFKVNSTASHKKEGKTRRDSTSKKKLEDYLDPVLLSAICARIGTAKTKLPKKEIKDVDFEWPVEDLKAFMENPMIGKEDEDWRSKAAVDLNDDSETTAKGGGDVEENEFCSTFWRFEEPPLKRFKR